MKTILLLGSIFLYTITLAPTKEVYICNNKKADKYHYSSTCRGLGNCQYKVSKITLVQAEAKGMTLCTWENKKTKKKVK